MHHMRAGAHKDPEAGLDFRSPGTGGIGSCELSNVGAGNQMGFSPRMVSTPKCSSHLLLVREE